MGWQEVASLMAGLAALIAAMVQVVRLFWDWKQDRKKRR